MRNQKNDDKSSNSLVIIKQCLNLKSLINSNYLYEIWKKCQLIFSLEKFQKLNYSKWNEVPSLVFDLWKTKDSAKFYFNTETVFSSPWTDNDLIILFSSRFGQSTNLINFYYILKNYSQPKSTNVISQISIIIFLLQICVWMGSLIVKEASHSRPTTSIY